MTTVATASRPRVLFVSAVPDFKGGAEIVLRTMLANPHIDPVLAVPEDGALAAAARCMGVAVCMYHPTAMLQVHRPPRLRPMLAALADAQRCALRLRRLAGAHGCTILHSNGLKPHMLSAILGTLPLSRPRTLVHLHDIAYRRSERLLWRVLANRVDRVIMVSRPCYPAATLPANVAVVPNGIVLVGSALPPSRAPGPLRLGFVGRFHPNKGLDLLLDWFAAMRRGGPEATLTIRGRPDPDLPQYWDHIRARIDAEGMAPFVHQEGWVTGAATYADLDVLLMTSSTPDPAPLVVPEAMSAGVVVAGYPAGGVPGMIEDGRTGLLVETGEDLARRLHALTAEPGRLQRMREAAHETVTAEFSTARFHRRLYDVYCAMLSRGMAPAAAAEPQGASI